jgi:hypothetical protein
MDVSVGIGDSLVFPSLLWGGLDVFRPIPDYVNVTSESESCAIDACSAKQVKAKRSWLLGATQLVHTLLKHPNKWWHTCYVSLALVCDKSPCTLLWHCDA